MGISVSRPYEPYQAVHEESIPELPISKIDWEVERTYEIQEVGAESIIARSLVEPPSRPSISIHLGHVEASLQLLHSSA
jgi:hypothetical protein